MPAEMQTTPSSSGTRFALPERDFEERRYLRAALIYSLGALESYISKVIDSYIAVDSLARSGDKRRARGAQPKALSEERSSNR